MTNKPTPSQLQTALIDHGVDFKTYARWDTRGGTWGAYGGGLDGIVMHHTSTASATGSSGCPTLYWCAETYDWAIANMVMGRGPGDTYLLSAKPAYHSGDGGPWPAIGIDQAANVGHHQLFGIEIDDPGVKFTLTDYQIENAARVAAALSDLCGWPDDGSRIVTHQAWTDGSYGVNPKGPSPYLGRKGDTIHGGGWAEYPGEKVASGYNPVFWREQAAKYRIGARAWDGTVPTRNAVVRSINEALPNAAAWRLACRLYDMGYGPKPRPKGEQLYPAEAVGNIQRKWGWSGNGGYSERTHKRIWAKAK